MVCNLENQRIYFLHERIVNCLNIDLRILIDSVKNSRFILSKASRCDSKLTNLNCQHEFEPNQFFMFNAILDSNIFKVEISNLCTLAFLISCIYNTKFVQYIQYLINVPIFGHLGLCDPKETKHCETLVTKPNILY